MAIRSEFARDTILGGIEVKSAKDALETYSRCSPDGMLCHLIGSKRLFQVLEPKLVGTDSAEVEVSEWVESRAHGVAYGQTIYYFKYQHKRWVVVGSKIQLTT